MFCPLQPPPVITVVLNVQMHCDACAQALQKRIRKIKGILIQNILNILNYILLFSQVTLLIQNGSGVGFIT